MKIGTIAKSSLGKSWWQRPSEHFSIYLRSDSIFAREEIAYEVSAIQTFCRTPAALSRSGKGESGSGRGKSAAAELPSICNHPPSLDSLAELQKFPRRTTRNLYPGWLDLWETRKPARVPGPALQILSRLVCSCHRVIPRDGSCWPGLSMGTFAKEQY